MSTHLEISDKQTVEGVLNTVHARLKSYTNDQMTILDDIMSTIESFYKTEKYTHEKMQVSLHKSLEHAQSMPYLGQSIIGSTWTTAVKELIEHYDQREASYPVLKLVILENLKKVKSEKNDEFSKIQLYHDEIIKEMVDAERRTIKSRRAYDEACERVRQHLTHPVKEKESTIKRFHQKVLPKAELETLEAGVVDARNLYILNVCIMNYALEFYIKQFIAADLDKLLVNDLFPQIEQILDDLTFVEYKRLHDTLHRAIHVAIEDGDEQKRRFLPTNFNNYPLVIISDQTDQINTEDRYLPQLSSAYTSAVNDVREMDLQIQQILDSAATNTQNKESRIDPSKIRLKRMEMRRALATFVIDTLESLVPKIKTTPPARVTSKPIAGLKLFMSSSSKTETNNNTVVQQSNDVLPSSAPPAEPEPQPATSTGPSYPCQAIVLYDFEATAEDEMSVRKDEKIFIQSKPEYEGWLIAKGRDGSGLVPEAYVQLIAPAITVVKQDTPKTSSNKLNLPFGKKTSKTSSKGNTNTTIAAATAADEPPTSAADDADYFSDE